MALYAPPSPPPQLQVGLRVARSLRARLVKFSDEAAERVARDELLAHQLEARRGRGVVGLEPLLDGAALVGESIYLFAVATGKGNMWPQKEDMAYAGRAVGFG